MPFKYHTQAYSNKCYTYIGYYSFKNSLSCIFNFRNCVELLKKKANPNLKDINGFVPLHYAAESGNLEVVKLLINNHAYVDAV